MIIMGNREKILNYKIKWMARMEKRKKKLPFICLFSKPIANYIPRNTPFMKLRGPKLEIFIVARLVTGSNIVKPVMEFQGAWAAQIRIVLWIHIFLSNEISQRTEYIFLDSKRLCTQKCIPKSRFLMIFGLKFVYSEKATKFFEIFT